MIDRGTGGRAYSRKKNGPINSPVSATTRALKNPATSKATESFDFKRGNNNGNGAKSKQRNDIQYGMLTSTGKNGKMKPVRDNNINSNYKQYQKKNRK